MCDVGRGGQSCVMWALGGSHVCCRPWGAVMCVVGHGGQSCVL